MEGGLAKQLRRRAALHALQDLLRLQPRAWEARDLRSRRRSQQRRLLREFTTLDPDGLTWLQSKERGARFWRGLRWGGPGLLLGWWLAG